MTIMKFDQQVFSNTETDAVTKRPNFHGPQNETNCLFPWPPKKKRMASLKPLLRCICKLN